MKYAIIYAVIGFVYFCIRYIAANLYVDKINKQLTVIKYTVKYPYIFCKAVLWPLTLIRFVLCLIIILLKGGKSNEN